MVWCAICIANIFLDFLEKSMDLAIHGEDNVNPMPMEEDGVQKMDILNNEDMIPPTHGRTKIPPQEGTCVNTLPSSPP